MAKESYVKKVFLDFQSNLKNVKQNFKDFTINAKNEMKDSVTKFYSDLTHTTNKGLQLKELSKEIESMRNKYNDLLEQKQKLLSTKPLADYFSKQKEIEKLGERKEELVDKKLEDGLTEEEKQELISIKAQILEFEREQKEFDRLHEKYLVEGNSNETDAFSELFDQLDALNDINDNLEELSENIQETKKKERITKSKTQKDFETSSEEFKDAAIEGLSNKAEEMLTGLFSKVSSILKDGYNELKEMSSFSLATSLQINQEARDNALMYGFTDAQSYAFEKAKRDVGANSEEDLYLMTEKQQEYFAQRIGYYTTLYDKYNNKEYYSKFSQMQVELQDIKTDLQMSVVDFLVTNKDTIMFLLQTTVAVLEGIFQMLSGYLWLIGKESKTSIMSDTINNYSNGGNKNVNVKMENNYNGISSDDVNKLRKASNDSNMQLINALKGVS